LNQPDAPEAPHPGAELPGLDGPWAESAGPLSQSLPIGAGHPWALPGRRAVLLGTVDAGLREAWIHPFRIMQGVTLRVDRTATTAVSLAVTPEQVVRCSLAGNSAVTERWTTALEHPVVVWQVEAPEGLPVLREWTVDLRAGGSSDATEPAPDCALAPDGRGAVLRWPGRAFRLIVDVEGGTLAADLADAPAVRISVRSSGRCRVRVTGASDDADLERSRQMLARRGLSGLRRQRADHASELSSYATSIETPEPELAEAFEWAKVGMDGLLVGTPGVGRCLVSGYMIGDPATGQGDAASHVGEDACLVALAQLAAGDRNGPRDTLKFLSLTQGDDGRVIEECSTSGEARFGSAAIPHYLLLAARYAAWTGELDFLSRRWTAIRRAIDFALAGRLWSPGDALAAVWANALASLPPLAEALGHQEMAEDLATHALAARGRVPDATLPLSPLGGDQFRDGRHEQDFAAWRDLASLVRRNEGGARAWAGVAAGAVEGLWGVIPDALEGAARISPWFPPDWDAMSVERIRVGRTVLSVRMRRRFGQVAARIERVHGPRLHVEFVLRGVPALTTVLLDDVELGGGRVAFEADGTHALVWHP